MLNLNAHGYKYQYIFQQYFDIFNFSIILLPGEKYRMR